MDTTLEVPLLAR